MNNRIERPFQLRSEPQRRWLLENNWCENCDAADLGMLNPREFEIDGRISVEGDCIQCRQTVVSEINERELPES